MHIFKLLKSTILFPIKIIFHKILSNFNLINLTKGNRFIFLYHDISEDSEFHNSEHYSISIKNFKKHLDLLNNIFEIIPLNKIVSDKNLANNKNYASITFDDGFLSILEKAAPLMKKFNLPYAIFVNGSAIEFNQSWITNLIVNYNNNHYIKNILKTLQLNENLNLNTLDYILKFGSFNKDFLNQYMVKIDKKIFLDKKDLQILIKEGVPIENHTYDHLVLSKCADEIINQQILKNKILLSSLRLSKNLHFSIPFGKKRHYNENIIQKIKFMGYKFIYTTVPAKFRKHNLDDKNFLFPRIAPTNHSSKELLYLINRALFFNADKLEQRIEENDSNIKK